MVFQKIYSSNWFEVVLWQEQLIASYEPRYDVDGQSMSFWLYDGLFFLHLLDWKFWNAIEE